MMKNILLPTDFSKNAHNAMRYALQLFKNQKCRFYLLHTYTPAVYHSGKMLNSFSSLELMDIIKNNAEENIKKLKQDLIDEFRNSKHQFETIVSFNVLVSEIKDVIEQKKIELIVMGTQGATGSREIFLGTHTMYTIKKVKCPVLAVPSKYTFKIPGEALFATDYKNIIERDLDLIKEFQNLYKGHLHILNVYEGEPQNSAQIGNKKLIMNYFAPNKPILHITEGEDIAHAIEKFQKDNEIDLIIMVNNKHSFFENILFKPVINQLVYHTNIPFLVIPSGIKTEK
ncbi:universal stress protein [Christiangramia sediminis]|uniref:Universal stress protein n=1 Tax=Christiangramia sediminis TaxID=2881336 RepID=A0A9X1LIW7_9FLAO|nr:universal stress protein [Christiangramia sediminis]MCB7481034.1 universal stress protein [Christiangramia sediminis]